MTSNIAVITYAATGKSVNGGCVGLPAQPRNPLNVRPFSVSVGRTENLRTGISPLVAQLPPGSGGPVAKLTGCQDLHVTRRQCVAAKARVSSGHCRLATERQPSWPNVLDCFRKVGASP